ncbi:hypothetical protein SDC9_50614 [bioreactor metagenome]|uniref:Uncharacterized protein n=1 Tax=bioreactor metagenome TaxID=1076179 RepID=A0A644WL78_9ZZZZ
MGVDDEGKDFHGRPGEGEGRTEGSHAHGEEQGRAGEDGRGKHGEENFAEDRHGPCAEGYGGFHEAPVGVAPRRCHGEDHPWDEKVKVGDDEPSPCEKEGGELEGVDAEEFPENNGNEAAGPQEHDESEAHYETAQGQGNSREGKEDIFRPASGRVDEVGERQPDGSSEDGRARREDEARGQGFPVEFPDEQAKVVVKGEPPLDEEALPQNERERPEQKQPQHRRERQQQKPCSAPALHGL